MKPTWDEYYLDVARQVAKRSSCSRRQVGAVIVAANRIISTGYNGTPRGVTNCDEGGCPRCANTTIPSGEKIDTCLCSHAEENAIVAAAYHGIATKGAILYTTFSCCLTCAKMAINAGIKSIKYGGRYTQDSDTLLRAAGMENQFIGYDFPH